MSGLSQSIFDRAPLFLQNLLVSVYNLQYLRRHGGIYRERKALYARTRTAPLEELLEIQSRRLAKLVRYAVARSPFYARLYRGIDVETIRRPADLARLPVVDKEMLRTNLDQIVTVPKRRSCAVRTGGSTGKSLEVRFAWSDIQDRYAMLDAFRERFGYRFGDRMAWFSGKSLVTPRDLRAQRFWKTDVFFKIRYYSTLHLARANLPHYVDDLNRFDPVLVTGFPGSVFEIAHYALRSGHRITARPRAIFLTAETLREDQTRVIEEAFGSTVRDQYASAEGAPFATECMEGRMHAELLSGVFEIVDQDLRPASEGELIVTSFHTYGTPLIRYRIGDTARFEEGSCACGSACPLIRILGRAIEYVYSEERGKVVLTNMQTCLKEVPGVVGFQLLQDAPDRLTVRAVVDRSVYSAESERTFARAIADRLGEAIEVTFEYADMLLRTANGKIRGVIRTFEPPD